MSDRARAAGRWTTVTVGVVMSAWHVLDVLSVGAPGVPVADLLLFPLSREIDVFGLGLLLLVAATRSGLRRRVTRSLVWRDVTVVAGVVVSAYAGLFVFVSLSRLGGVTYFAPSGAAGLLLVATGLEGLFE